jgi:hypothetical protein
VELGDHAGSPDTKTKGPLGHDITLVHPGRAGEGRMAYTLGRNLARHDNLRPGSQLHRRRLLLRGWHHPGLASDSSAA